jgi:hypothetical protein
MNTFYIERDTAKLIHRVRQAHETIARIECEQPSRQEWRNIAHIELNGSTVAVRSDILSKWCELAGREFGCLIEFGVTEKGEIRLRCQQAQCTLATIDIGNTPPLFPIQLRVSESSGSEGELKLAVDPSELIAKAKKLSSDRKGIQTRRKVAEQAKREEAERAEYERAKAILTPENIRREVKRRVRARKLAQWARRVDRLMAGGNTYPPNPFELENHPDLQMFDPEYLPAYATAFGRYYDARRRLNNFRPRSWRSDGKRKHTENVATALRGLRSVVNQATAHHVRIRRCSLYDLRLSDLSVYDSDNVNRARQYVRRAKVLAWQARECESEQRAA